MIVSVRLCSLQRSDLHMQEIVNVKMICAPGDLMTGIYRCRCRCIGSCVRPAFKTEAPTKQILRTRVFFAYIGLYNWGYLWPYAIFYSVIMTNGAILRARAHYWCHRQLKTAEKQVKMHRHSANLSRKTTNVRFKSWDTHGMYSGVFSCTTKTQS